MRLFVLEYRSNHMWKALLQSPDKDYLVQQLQTYRKAGFGGMYRIAEYEVSCGEPKTVDYGEY